MCGKCLCNVQCLGKVTQEGEKFVSIGRLTGLQYMASVQKSVVIC